MEISGFWSGVITVLALLAFAYFLYTRIQAAKRKRETRDAYIPPRTYRPPHDNNPLP